MTPLDLFSMLKEAMESDVLDLAESSALHLDLEAPGVPFDIYDGTNAQDWAHRLDVGSRLRLGALIMHEHRDSLWVFLVGCEAASMEGPRP